MLWHLYDKLKILRQHIIYAVLIVIYLIIISKIKCPFYTLFNIKCPTCGVTRALICILTLNIKGYISYNAMALPLIICVLLEIHKSFLKKQILIDTLCILILIINLFYYFTRFF
ncbi:MAG: DUF2752 domain-containing protein [Clostridia bacterium]|nr:DUF2752 domain-containing protein [Clostridia bacterium]